MADDDRIIRAGWTWPQRLQQARTDVPPDTPGTEGDWRAWQRAVDPHGAGLFARRLSWDGLSEAAARALLAGPPAGAQPDWLPDLADLRTAIRGADPDDPDQDLADLPFAALLSPMVTATWNRLAPDPAWTPAAHTALRRDLGQRLAEVCSAAFFTDFAATRPQGTALQSRLGVGRGEDTAFRAWCRARSADGLHTILRQYPVLGRLLAVTARSWWRSTTDLRRRVATHRGEIAAAFGISADATVTGVRPGLSDPHRGGHRVAVLEFGTGEALVYKPKDLRLEQHFQRLVAAVNAHFPDHRLHEVRVLPGDGPYGFTSLVRHQPCPPGQLPGFYVAAGRLIALLYLLGATDAHYENVMATGSTLALIDSETLFHTDTSGEPAGPLSDTVLRTGMLPGWVLVGRQQVAYDPSALGVSPPANPAVAGWAHVNTDDMIWTRLDRRPPAPLSLPVEDPAHNPLPDHVEDLVAGYRDIHLACGDPSFRDMLLAAVAGFRGLPQRVVVRATRIYGVIGQRALAARSLAAANARAFELERLARVALVGAQRDPAWAVFQAELHDMENLDIPYFEHTLGSDVVVGGLGPVHGLVTGDATRAAAQRIAALDADELAWQEALIRGSVRARWLRADQDAPPTATGQGTGQAPDVPDLLAAIERGAVRRKDGAPPTWLTLSRLPDGEHVHLGTVGDGWYDGRTGIAAVQRWAAEAGVGPDLAEQAADTAAPVLERLRHADPHTRSRYLRALGPGLTGVGGVLRWLAPGDRTRLLAGFPASLIDDDRTYDLIGGVAGLIGPLTSADSAELLTAAAEHLVAGQSADGGWRSRLGSRPLTGLAHGAAGCGLALLEAGAALARPDLVEAGAAAFRYEAGLYDPGTRNWPDLREGGSATPMVAWCHGAAGIGLSRLRALQILPGHADAIVWREHLDAAMDTTAAAPRTANDHLCCGLTGRAAVLRIAGRAMAQPRWLAAADELTAVVADRYARTGRFRLPMDIPGQAAPVPGLMTGVAGIAAHLLSVSTGGDLRAFLL